MDDLEERKLSAVREISELLDLYAEAEIKITEELKAKGLLTPGLDGNTESYAPLNKKFDRKIAEVLEKYNLPPGTKLKLW